MDQRGISGCGGSGEVLDRLMIQEHGHIYLTLSPFHVSVGCTVNDDVNLL